MNPNKAIEKFLQDRVRRGCKPNSVQTYRDQLRLFADFLRARRIKNIEQVSPKHLDSYLADLRARPKINRNGVLSPVTIRKHMLALRSFFHFLKRARIMRRDPAAHVPLPSKPKRKPKTLAPAQVRALCDRKRWTHDARVARDYALILLMLDSGLRLSEVAALAVEDVDLERRTVHVRQGKGDKERYSVFTRLTARAVSAIAPQKGNLFGMSALAIYRAVVSRGQQVGVSVSPHRLRHTWITEFLNNGGKIHVAQALAGHESIQTTIEYSSIALADVVREYPQFSPLRLLPK